MSTKYLDQQGLGVLWGIIKGKFATKDDLDTIVVRGYLLNGKFYTDSTYTTELEKDLNRIYIDVNTSQFYSWTGSKFELPIQEATEDEPGIAKLYKQSGENEDGSMTQKVVTEGVQSIKFKLNSGDTECLELDLPW